MSERSYTPKEAAAALSVSLATIYNGMSSGKIAFVKPRPGRQRFIPQKEIARLRKLDLPALRDAPVFDHAAINELFAPIAPDPEGEKRAAKKMLSSASKKNRAFALKVRRNGVTWTW